MVFFPNLMYYVSIHAPRAGCDANRHRRDRKPPVSIHAPRAGCDEWALSRNGNYLRFNSRTPCGVRRQTCVLSPRTKSFNSRTPCGVRPAYISFVGQLINVSIHAPRAGCDDSSISALARSLGFNSRTPCGVRPNNAVSLYVRVQFQFTHPVRGATKV